MEKEQNQSRPWKGTIQCHDSVFHSDEIIAIALLNLLDEDTVVIRTRDTIKTEFTVDVGGEYSPLENKFDHHHFKEGDPYYGLSSAGLVLLSSWTAVSEKYKSMEDINDLVKAVDARDTRVNYDESNQYEVIFNAITACNHMYPMSEEQDSIFVYMVAIMKKIIDALGNKDLETYTEWVEVLENLAVDATSQKEVEFAKREINLKELDNALIGEFFPGWRARSRESGKVVVFPGDREDEYKIMIDTSSRHIIKSSDEVFTHSNGFISVVKPKGDIITVELSDGDMITIPVKELK